MTTKQHLSTSISIQLHHIVALFVIFMAILQIMKKYELICKRRNYHNPQETDLDKFLNEDTVNVNTECVDCGCALQLLSDEFDSETYWIKEI